MSRKSDDNEIPGFYYDPVKKRHFRIQSNNFGVASVITGDLIKRKANQIELDRKLKVEVKRTGLVDLAMRQELGIDSHLRTERTNQIILNHSLREIYSINQGDLDLKQMHLIKNLPDEQQMIYLLVNLVNAQIQYFHVKAIPRCLLGQKKNELIEPQPVEIYFRQRGERNFYTSISSPAQIQNQNHLIEVKNVISPSAVKFKLRISRLDKVSEYMTEDNYSLNAEELHSKEYQQQVWTTQLNSRSDSYIVGLESSACLTDMQHGRSISFDTSRSVVYSAQFKADTDDKIVLLGCKNKNLYVYDLRQSGSSQRSSTRPIYNLQHASCVNQIVSDPRVSNLIYTNDFSGAISLWDLRTRKVVNQYHENLDSNANCSIKLSPCGSYLYYVAKDGHVRIYNTIQSKLVRTLLSPIARSPQDMYPDMPSIELMPDYQLFYGIKNKIMLFS